MTGDRWLIAGLGNPGPSYAGNRHNAGYLTADVLAARAGARFRAGKFRAATAEGRPGQLLDVRAPESAQRETIDRRGGAVVASLVELISSGLEPLSDLMAALHQKALVAELQRQRSARV